MSSELTVDITDNPLTTTKPLPTVPRSNDAFLLTPTSALTVEAREHLRSFVRHCLDEDTHSIISEVDRDVWTDAFERALTELGHCITRGGWLKGIRRRRTVQKRIQAVSQDQEGAISSSNNQDKPEAIKATASSQQDPGPSGASGLIAFPTIPSPTSGTSHNVAIEQLRQHVSKPSPSTPKLLARHLLLCLSPLGNQAILSLDPRPLQQQLGSSSCVFTPKRFAFPEQTSDDARRVLLYGLDEWDVTSPNLRDDTLQIVGGTFTFTSINSPLQHNLLAKTLRLSIYVYLSLLLEQSLLSCSGINLEYDRRRPASPTTPAPISAPMMTRGSSAIEVSSKTHTRSPRSIGGGILSFLTKRGDRYFHRTTSSDLPSISRGGSLDIDRRSPSPKPPLGDDMSALGRLRKFSFITDSKPASVLQQQRASQDEFADDSPYDAALKRIGKYKSLLSTSPGIVLAPPPLLVTLAAKEKKDASRRTKGDEKMGLMTLLGWEGKESKGKGMTGTAGFVKQQEITFVHSKYVPQEPSPPPPPASLLSSSSSPENGPGAVSPSSRESEEKPKLTKCGQARWVTYRYYAFGDHEDKTLEDVVTDTCAQVDEPCEEPDCHFKACEHETRWLHGVTRVSSRIKKDEQTSQPSSNALQIWESCKLCGRTSSKQDVSDGAALISFAKFLELLVYSPSIISLTPSLCEHTSIPPRPWQGDDLPLPRSRFNIVRHFLYGTASLSFELTEISEVFELRVPRLQIVRGVPRERAAELLQTVPSEEPPRDEKLVLRKEMLNWWHGVAEHMDKLEASFNADHQDSQRHSMKSLPRLPSTDTPLEEDENDDALKTPRAHDNQAHFFDVSRTDFTNTVRSRLSMRSNSSVSTATAEISDSVPSLHQRNRDGTTSGATDPSSSAISSSSQPTAQTSSTTGASADPVMLLFSLRQSFLRTEQVLYSQLARTPVSSLNDVRRAFQSAARGASKRLTAWQSKHLPKTLKSKSAIGKLSVPEPEWWGKACHPAPGSSVIVREDDWGSIIAYTLSSMEYQKELGQMTGVRQGPTPSLPSTPPPVPRKSFFSGRLFSSSHLPMDPDQEGHVWHEPEAFSAAVTREEHPRDPSGLLSIREVLRQKAPEHVGLSSRFIGFGVSGSKATNGGIGSAAAPPSAWAKPAVEVSKQAADGLVINGLPECDDGGPGGAEKILHDMEATSSDIPSLPSRPGSAFGSYGPSTYETHIRRWKTSSIISADNSLNSQETSIDEQFPPHSEPAPPPLPLKDRQKDDGNKQMQAEKPLPATTDPTLTPTTSGFTASITNSLTNAMRLMLMGGETSRSTSPIPRNHHGLLTVESMGWDEKPHIKHDWMVGKRLKFSCVVYYAKQFDGLRRRCGLEENFLQSLGRSLNWAAQGGKSRSNFWKTSDDRYIIKTLVDAWNVADLQVLLDLAPSYFRYMDSTHNRPTVLAKLLGFYTVEIKNLETGSVQTKADLLVMENLFFNQRIAKTFDLKGIAGRKVKAGPTGSNVGSKTLFDGEWIEDQQHTLTLVYPHSKLILREAVKRDCEFLAQSNIMDYSLLLGIDEETKQIACGLVDTIGSYTFAKTLEYKAKQGLSSGKTPTVIPPNEYQERFVNAIESYFLASPDKWTKPEDETKIVDDYKLLPCVL